MSDPTRRRTPSQPAFGSRHRRTLLRLRDKASYIKVYHDFVRFLGLSIEEAAILGDMFSTANISDCEANDGWFDYTVEWMRGRTDVQTKAQQRLINALKDGGWIEVAKAGNPARRRVRLNVEAIENTIDECLNNPSGVEINRASEVENDLTRELEIDPTPCIKEDKQRLTPSGGCGGRERHQTTNKTLPSISIDKKAKGSLVNQEANLAIKEDWFALTARRLKGVISANHKIPSFNQTKWAKDLKTLRASLDGDEDAEVRIEAVIEWLSANWKTQRSPINSVEGLIRRFSVLESMMEQSQLKGLRPGAQGLDPPAPQISELPEEVREELEEIRWRNGTPEALPQAYADALTGAKRLIKLVDQVGDEDSDERFLLQEFNDSLGRGPMAMAVRWIKWCATKRNGWAEWGGSFSGMELSPNSKFFVERFNDVLKKELSQHRQSLLRALREAW